MATTPSVKVIKTTPYKAGTQTWSNRYHFNGGTPADATHWHTLMDNIVNAEKAALDSDVTIVECIGYNAGSDLPVATKNYTTVGTFTPTGSWANTPLFVAGLVRYSTTARTSKNHPVYLFNYYHRAIVIPGAEQETLNASWKTALDTYAGQWITGFSDGSITAVRAGPNGATATGHQVGAYATHRDFPD